MSIHTEYYSVLKVKSCNYSKVRMENSLMSYLKTFIWNSICHYKESQNLPFLRQMSN